MSSAACLDLPSQRAIRDRWLARATCPSERLQTQLLIACQPGFLLSLHRIPFPFQDKPCLGSARRYHIYTLLALCKKILTGVCSWRGYTMRYGRGCYSYTLQPMRLGVAFLCWSALVFRTFHRHPPMRTCLIFGAATYVPHTFQSVCISIHHISSHGISYYCLREQPDFSHKI